MSQVRKAVFPVAGQGTRFLPATKANPKEMLSVVDKPLIQYAVEEAIESGIKELIFVTSSSKRAIEDHFDANVELENSLKQKGKTRLLNLVYNIVPKGVSCIYVRQAQALGLGHAILCAKEVVGNEPFAVLLADDLIYSAQDPCLKQMLNVYNATKSSVVAVQRIDPSESDKYGIVDIKGQFTGKGAISSIVEKPDPLLAPSNLGVVGRYILTPEIFKVLSQTDAGSGGEIQLTDGISKLLNKQKVMALEFEGKRYDCGSKLGYLQATVDLGLEHSETGDEFKNYLLQLSVET